MAGRHLAYEPLALTYQMSAECTGAIENQIRNSWVVIITQLIAYMPVITIIIISSSI